MNHGNIIDGDMLLAIFSKYLKKKGKLNNNTLVATIMSNMGLSKFAKENDITLKQTKVGDRYVLEEMLKGEYNIGGEQSGHVILLDYNPTGDRNTNIINANTNSARRRDKCI
jgi:phosphoglucosamine mutase